MQQGFGWNAPAIKANASRIRFPVDQRDLHSKISGEEGGSVTTGPSAYNRNVQVCIIWHWRIVTLEAKDKDQLQRLGETISLSNLHVPDKTVDYLIDVLHRSIQNHSPAQIADHLMDVDHHASTLISFEANWFHVRIYQGPLPRPVGANAFTAVNPSAFYSVGPNNVRMHECQNGIYIALIERFIDGDQQIALS